MNRVLSLIVTIIIVVMSLTSCSSIDKTDNNDLVIFAASSLTETLTEIGDIYLESNPDISLTFNFDSSGTLKTQIEEGAHCDLFISASSTQMNELNVVLNDSRVDLLDNKIALVAPNGNPANIQSFDDLANKLESGDLFMAVGNADVPVGEYTFKIFDYYGLSPSELDSKGCLTYGSNVKEVTTQVAEEMVDCGIVYQTDAFSAKLDVIDTATADMCGRVTYPVAVLSTSDNIDEAKKFIDYLTSGEATAVFEKVGFTPLT